MSSILSLHNVHEQDHDKVGFKAVDLAKLHVKKITIPLTFIITFQAFKDFMEQNGLNMKINRLLSGLDLNNDKELLSAYETIKEWFVQAEFSETMKEDLFDAYTTLSIDASLDASKLVSAEEKPFVVLIRSLSYIIDPDDNEGILQNIKGKHRFFTAVKMCWASLYSPKALVYRHMNDIGHDVQTAIIVKKMVLASASAETYSRDLKAENDDVRINSFLGLPDYETPIKGDHHEVSKDDLSIRKAQINFQQYKLARDPETGELEKVFLKESGYQQKVHDKLIMELARLTKRISGFLNKEVKAFFYIKNESIYLSHCNKIIDIEQPKPQPKIVQEQAQTETEPTPLEIKAELEQEPSFDPDTEDLGVSTGDVELEEDLAFLESLEKEEKELDKCAEIEKGLEQDKKEIRGIVKDELVKEEIETYEEELPTEEPEKEEQKEENIFTNLKKDEEA